LIDRNVRFRRQQHRDRIHRQVGETDALDFFNILTGPELLQITEAHLPEHRERLYPPTVTLSMFLRQVLQADRSCQRAVNAWAAQRAAEGLHVDSIRTGAYCQARQRLPLELITQLTCQSGRLLSDRAECAWRWRERAVKLVDGTVFSMPDTLVNQECYPQHLGQAEGVGFPLGLLVGIICLSSGALLSAAFGAKAGKGCSELELFRRQLQVLRPGDVVLGDALYCNYFVIAALQASGVDVLFEQHGSRTTDFRRGHSLGQHDHLVHWLKPRQPQWMTAQQYEALPNELRVREVRVKGQILVTTMHEARAVRKNELSELYARRWQIELDIRNIKTTLGMQVLSCKSPQMIHKELWVYLLAYNLIRLLMAQAAQRAGVHPRTLSFKHTVQLWIEWVGVHRADFFRLLAQLSVGSRPGRVEPRARKRRPKTYPRLQVPRAIARRQLQAQLLWHEVN
jgi:hypothetical protein